MKKFETGNKRNVGIAAHSGAGKTTLAETILFNAKAIEKPGRVDDGSSNLDFEPEEINRKITLFSSVFPYEWKNVQTYLVDTPGFSNFIHDTKGCIRILDSLIVILSAISGAKLQTEQVWEFADEFEVPRIVFVNKMDRERANFMRAVDDVEKTLKTRALIMQLPIGAEDSFKGVIDLLKMEAFVFSKDFSGKFEKQAIPDELKDEAAKYREKLIETVAEADDALIEKYLDGQELTEEEILKALKEGTITRKFVPVFCGSAYYNIGIQMLMDGVIMCLPSPLERGDAIGNVPGQDEKIKREPDESQPFSSIVFKTISDLYAGKVSVFKVLSGKISSDSNVYNSNKEVRERIGQILLIEGKKFKAIPEAAVGDIVGFAKLKDTETGDTLCDPGFPIKYQFIKEVNPVISFAIQPKSKGDEDKLSNAIQRLKDEDKALRFSRDEQTKQHMISGTGQVHIEVATEKLKRKYGVDVELKTPKVPYKETIEGSTKVQGKYKKQTGGHGQYGDVWIEIEHLRKGEGFKFVDKIVGGAIPRQYIPAVEKGLEEALQKGVIAGYPVVDIKISLFDGSYHSVDSSELAFKVAASLAFKKGVETCKPVLLEPIMKMEVVVPDENMGDVIGDLNSKRGKVIGVEPKANSQAIKVNVPMAEVLSYSNDLRSMTSGRGIFTMEFSHYEKVPPHLSEKIIAAKKKEMEEANG